MRDLSVASAAFRVASSLWLTGRATSISITTLAIIQLTGCATALVPERIFLESTARYGELTKLEEAELKRSGETAFNLYNLCYAYSKIKDYSKLFGCADRLERAIKSGDTQVALFTSIGSSDGTLTPYLFRAEAYIELSQYPMAIAQAEEAHRLAGRLVTLSGFDETQHKIHALGLLGLAQAFAGDRLKAKETVAALEDLSLGFVGFAQKAPMRNRAVARLYVALGECKKALDILSSSDGALARSFASALLGRGENLFATLELPNAYMRNKCLLETGSIREARDGYDKLLGIAQTSQIGEIYWLILFDRGRIAEIEASSKAAIRFYQAAIDVIERQRASIHTEANKIGFVGDKQSVYERLISLLVQQGAVAEAFDYVERSKARALVDMLASKKEFAIAGVDPEKDRLILAQLDIADRASRVPEVSAQSGENSGSRNLLLASQEIRNATPELSTLVTVSSVPVDDLRKLLGTREVLVEYYGQGRELYAFILDRERLQVTKLAGDGLADDVQAFRRAIERLDTKSWEEPGKRLYQRLWRPLEQAIRGKSVIVVAHGSLHYLPYSALVGPDGGFLIDHYNLRFLPSASVLKFLRPPLGRTPGLLLALGNPDLGDRSMDLKFAEQEAMIVARMFPDSRILLRREATKTNFKKAAGLFKRIHFATHGKFQAEDPLSSGLYLAKDGENDGLLTVDELYSMNLDADLVTLSACETGLGKIGNGDDVVGLTRGFLYAGSRSIVASLWSIDDEATVQVMRFFYENLSNRGKHEALREAQIKARKDYPHPFFWAAFQLTGRAD